MQVINHNKAKDNLENIIDTVADKNETVIITKNSKTVVIVSLEKFNSLEENVMDTCHKVSQKYAKVCKKLAE